MMNPRSTRTEDIRNKRIDRSIIKVSLGKDVLEEGGSVQS